MKLGASNHPCPTPGRLSVLLAAAVGSLRSMAMQRPTCFTYLIQYFQFPPNTSQHSLERFISVNTSAESQATQRLFEHSIQHLFTATRHLDRACTQPQACLNSNVSRRQPGANDPSACRTYPFGFHVPQNISNDCFASGNKHNCLYALEALYFSLPKVSTASRGKSRCAILWKSCSACVSRHWLRSRQTCLRQKNT